MQLERRQWVPEASENLVQDLADKVSGLSLKNYWNGSPCWLI